MAITEEEKNKALAILRKYEEQATHIIRDDVENDCPSKEFTPGEPNGECDGDGHYMCDECIHFNRDTIYT